MAEIGQLVSDTQKQAQQARQGVESQYQSGVSEVERQRAEAQADISGQAESQRTEIRRNIGESEAIIQKRLQDARDAQKQALKRRAVGFKAEAVSLPDVSELTEYQRRTGRLRKDVDTAEGEALADVASQASKLKSELTQKKESAISQIDIAEQVTIADYVAQYNAYQQSLAQQKPEVVTTTTTKVIAPPNTVKLDNGDYVDVDAFTKLGDDDRTYLLQHGVEAYNKKLLLSDWKPVQDFGTDFKTAVGLTEFAKMQREGKIPNNAIYKDAVVVNGVATKVDYTMPVEAVKPVVKPEAKPETQAALQTSKFVAPDWKPLTVLAGGIPMAVAEPTPVGELILIAAGVSAFAYVGGKWAYDNRAALQDALFQAKGKVSEVSQSLMITTDGKVQEFSADVKRQLEAMDYWQQKNIAPRIEVIQEGVKVNQAKAADTIEKILNTPPPQFPKGFEIKMPDVKSFITGVPLLVKNKLADVMEATATAVQSARDGLENMQTARQTEEVNMTRQQWNVIEEAYKVIEEKKISDAMQVVEDAMSQWRAEQNTEAIISLRRDLEDLEAKRQILEAAKKSYVASLNPLPQADNALTPEQAASAASILLTRVAIPESTPATVVPSKPATVDTVIATVIKQSVQAKPITTVKAYTQTLTQQAVKIATNTAPITYTDSQAALQNAAKQSVRTATKIVPTTLTQTQVKTATATAVKTVTATLTASKEATKPITRTLTRTAERTATPSQTATPPIPPLVLPDGKILKLTRKEYEGIVAWKQGFIYWLKYPPYDDAHTIHSRKPIAGVKYYDGIGSVVASIIQKHGDLPKEIAFNMGVQDVRIMPTGTNKPNIQFTRDIDKTYRGSIKTHSVRHSTASNRQPKRVAGRITQGR